MNVSETYWVYKSQCKDCKKPFGFTETALKTDVAHGLSTPLRCPECRKNNGAAISEAGLSYWPIPLD
jgi:cytochrome c-type biogenesis protein CcmH/NrfF